MGTLMIFGSPRRILVTGVYGLVGSACYDLFVKKGWEVMGIDNNGRSHFFGTAKTHYELDQRNVAEVDIRDEVAINKLFCENKFDAIIHAAAQPSHDYATDHVLEDFHVNATGTLHLLEATRKYCPQVVFVHVSTDKVYGENMQRKHYHHQRDTDNGRWPKPNDVLLELPTRYHCDAPFNEYLGLDFAGDRSFFGCSKAAADMYAQQYAARFGMKVGIFRPGCITGRNHAGAEQHGFLAYLAKCIKEGKTYTIYGNGKQVRDQIHASDLARSFEAYINNPKCGAVYNMGGGPARSVSVLEAISLIEEATGKKANYGFAEERKGDRRWDVHSTAKFERDYPEWKMKYSLQDIIKDLVA